jgi:hypothetical protein
VSGVTCDLDGDLSVLLPSASRIVGFGAASLSDPLVRQGIGVGISARKDRVRLAFHDRRPSGRVPCDSPRFEAVGARVSLSWFTASPPAEDGGAMFDHAWLSPVGGTVAVSGSGRWVRTADEVGMAAVSCDHSDGFLRIRFAHPGTWVGFGFAAAGRSLVSHGFSVAIAGSADRVRIGLFEGASRVSCASPALLRLRPSVTLAWFADVARPATTLVPAGGVLRWGELPDWSVYTNGHASARLDAARCDPERGDLVLSFASSVGRPSIGAVLPDQVFVSKGLRAVTTSGPGSVRIDLYRGKHRVPCTDPALFRPRWSNLWAVWLVPIGP